MTNDRITNQDKIDVLRNERKLKQGQRQASTFFGQAIIDMHLDAGGGRFVEKTGLDVTGTRDPSAQYPAASSPWTAQADPGVEPPTGQDINFVDPVGEQFEIEACLAASSDPALSQEQSPGVGDDGAALDATEKAHLTAEQHRVGTHDLHSVASSPSTNLAGDGGSTPTAVAPRAASSTASVETIPGHPSAEQPDEVPDDGLDDVPRRADGFPMSSPAIKPRKVTR